jgi:HSP20 family protein
MAARPTLPSLFERRRDLSPFAALQSEIDRTFDSFRAMFGREAPILGESGAIIPRMDLSESNGTLQITMDLPGVGDDDLDVSLADDVLTIKGARSEEREETDKNFHLVERSHGSFQRSIPLGFTVAPDKVKAAFKQGVLTVTVEKPAEAATKTSKIAVEKVA